MQTLETETEVPLEYQLFALAFKEPGAISTFNDTLPPYMVGLIHGQTGIHEFYQALVDFHNKTGLDPIDPIAFKAWLESETSIYDALGGPTGVSVFIDTINNVELSTVESVVKVLRFKANKRKQLDSIQELQTIINKKAHKTDEDIIQISKLTDQIRILESEIDYNPLDVVTTAGDIAERVDDLFNIPDFIPTPFKSLNRAMGYTDDGGYYRSAVHAIIAPSGKGKSTFAKCLCNFWADSGYKVLFVNFEEPEAHWETILFTQVIKENVYAHAKQWTEQEKEVRAKKFKDKLLDWGDRFMVRHDPDTSYFDDLERWLRDIMGHNENVPDIVVIDTIQSLLGKGGGPRWQDYEQMMIRLEKLAKDMNAVFILTAQQNTLAAKEKREVIEQYDIGGSISIVQKCSVITVITPKKMVSGDDSEDDLIMQLQIPKNRFTGSEFNGDPPLVRYIDESKSYVEFELVDEDFYNELTVPADLVGEDFLL